MKNKGVDEHMFNMEKIFLDTFVYYVKFLQRNP